MDMSVFDFRHDLDTFNWLTNLELCAEEAQGETDLDYRWKMMWFALEMLGECLFNRVEITEIRKEVCRGLGRKMTKGQCNQFYRWMHGKCEGEQRCRHYARQRIWPELYGEDYA